MCKHKFAYYRCLGNVPGVAIVSARACSGQSRLWSIASVDALGELNYCAQGSSGEKNQFGVVCLMLSASREDDFVKKAVSALDIDVEVTATRICAQGLRSSS